MTHAQRRREPCRARARRALRDRRHRLRPARPRVATSRARASVTLRIEVAHVPLLPGARDAWRAGVRTGGAERNVEYLEPLVDVGCTSRRRSARSSSTRRPRAGCSSPSRRPRSAEYLSRVPGAVEIGEVDRSRDASASCSREHGGGWGLVASLVFKTECDLTASGWVGSIPIHSRHNT